MIHRFLAGGGARWRPYSNENSFMHIGIGLFFENEKWKDFEGQFIYKNIWKTSNYISANLNLGNNGSLTMSMYYQGGYDTEDDVFRNRLSGVIGLEFGIIRQLKFVLDFSIHYEDRPIIPINKIVYRLSNGLRWEF